MKPYEVIWHEKVLRELKSLDKREAAEIVTRVAHDLMMDPVGLGKPSSDLFKGLLRYRTDDVRVIYGVDRRKWKIIVLHIKPRGNVRFLSVCRES